MYSLNHTIDIYTTNEKNMVFNCNAIAFDNTGSVAVALIVSNSRKVLSPGESLALNANHPEVLINTAFAWEFAGSGGQLTIIKDQIKKV
jgi:hypothetical protein